MIDALVEVLVRWATPSHTNPVSLAMRMEIAQQCEALFELAPRRGESAQTAEAYDQALQALIGGLSPVVLYGLATFRGARDPNTISTPSAWVHQLSDDLRLFAMRYSVTFRDLRGRLDRQVDTLHKVHKAMIGRMRFSGSLHEAITKLLDERDRLYDQVDELREQLAAKNEAANLVGRMDELAEQGEALRARVREGG